MDYLSPIFQETAYCLAVEKLLGIEVPERATVIRVLTMELTRISSHLVGLATGGMELGALTAMTNGFRERELVLDVARADHRPAHEPRVRPPRRRRAGPAGRRGGEGPRARRHAARAVRRHRGAARPASRSGRSACRASPTWTCRAASPSASPGRCCAAPASPGTCARSSRTAATRPTTSTSRSRPAPTAGAASRSGWREMHESLKIIEQALDKLRARAGHGGGHQDRLAGAAGHRLGRHGPVARARQEDHGHLDGGADPPLQAGDRGLPGPGRPGVRADRVAPRRARHARGQRRRHPAVPRPRARPELRQPAVRSRRPARVACCRTPSPPWPRSTRSWAAWTDRHALVRRRQDARERLGAR